MSREERDASFRSCVGFSLGGLDLIGGPLVEMILDHYIMENYFYT